MSLATLEFNGFLMSLFLTDWVSSLVWAPSLLSEEDMKDWAFPLIGLLKLNFDGAFKGNPGMAGFVCIIWNHSSIVIRACCGLWGIVAPLKLRRWLFFWGLGN